MTKKGLNKGVFLMDKKIKKTFKYFSKKSLTDNIKYDIIINVPHEKAQNEMRSIELQMDINNRIEKDKNANQKKNYCQTIRCKET